MIGFLSAADVFLGVADDEVAELGLLVVVGGRRRWVRRWCGSFSGCGCGCCCGCGANFTYRRQTINIVLRHVGLHWLHAEHIPSLKNRNFEEEKILLRKIKTNISTAIFRG